MKSPTNNLKICILSCILTVAVFSCEKNDPEIEKTVPVVTTSSASNVTTNSASVGGNITGDGNDPVTKSGIVYSSNVALPTTADNKVESTTITGLFTLSIDKLSSGTTYHVRAYAINSVGTGYGEVVDFVTGNAAPTASDLKITGQTEANKTVTASFTYADAEGDLQGASAYQWYVADNATGGGESAISGATSSTLLIPTIAQGKYLRFSVTPKAASGTASGIEVKSLYIGAVGEATTVTFTYNGASVTYGILNSSTTGKKWLDRNLGAAAVATKIDDYANFGDLFQWGRAIDGHQRITRTGATDSEATAPSGITSTTSPYAQSGDDTPDDSKFIVIPGTPGDWRNPQNDNLWQGVSGVNNPCPSGWRIPTKAEWTAEGFANGNAAYTKLKIPYTGQRDKNNGSITNSIYGLYWTSTIETKSYGGVTDYFVFDASSFFSSTFTGRGNAMACRCIKD